MRPSLRRFVDILRPVISHQPAIQSVKYSALTEKERPIFLLASGHRCGSTLVQRLLNSHPDILIWGEQNDYLNSFVWLFQELVEWTEKSSNDHKTFLLRGYDNFLPK